MFCTNCGLEISENSKFCMYCGFGINNASPNFSNKSAPVRIEKVIFLQGKRHEVIRRGFFKKHIYKINFKIYITFIDQNDNFTAADGKLIIILTDPNAHTYKYSKAITSTELSGKADLGILQEMRTYPKILFLDEIKINQSDFSENQIFEKKVYSFCYDHSADLVSIEWYLDMSASIQVLFVNSNNEVYIRSGGGGIHNPFM